MSPGWLLRTPLDQALAPRKLMSFQSVLFLCVDNSARSQMAEEERPAFLGEARRLAWPLPDPDRKEGRPSDEQRLEGFRTTRDNRETKLATLGGNELNLG